MWGGSKQKLSKDQKSDDGEFKAGQHVSYKKDEIHFNYVGRTNHIQKM